jgi:hypothetical protein
MQVNTGFDCKFKPNVSWDVPRLATLSLIRGPCPNLSLWLSEFTGTGLVGRRLATRVFGEGVCGRFGLVTRTSCPPFCPRNAGSRGRKRRPRRAANRRGDVDRGCVGPARRELIDIPIAHCLSASHGSPYRSNYGSLPQTRRAPAH